MAKTADWEEATRVYSRLGLLCTLLRIYALTQNTVSVVMLLLFPRLTSVWSVVRCSIRIKYLLMYSQSDETLSTLFAQKLFA